MEAARQILIFGSLTLFSLADLRFRSLPGVRVFFVVALLFGLAENPWQVLMIFLVAGWGSRLRMPAWLTLPAIFYPPVWPVLLTAVGVRRNHVAKGDLLVMGGIALLMDWYGPLLALLGVMCWRRLWKNRNPDTVPAVPGMLVGVLLERVLFHI